MTCEEMRARWNDRLDGELPSAECAALDAHAEECEACGRYAREMATIFNGLALLREESDQRAMRLAARNEGLPSGGELRKAPLRRWFAVATLARAAAILLAISLALLWPRGTLEGTSPESNHVRIVPRAAEMMPASTAARTGVALLGESAEQYLAVPQKSNEPNVQLYCLFTVLPVGGEKESEGDSF